MLADKHVGKQPRRFSNSVCSVSPSSFSVDLTYFFFFSFHILLKKMQQDSAQHKAMEHKASSVFSNFSIPARDPMVLLPTLPRTPSTKDNLDVGIESRKITLHTYISISVSSLCISVGENSKLEIHLLLSHIFVGSVVNVVDCILAYMRLVLLEATTRWRTLALRFICCPCCC